MEQRYVALRSVKGRQMELQVAGTDTIERVR